MKTRGFYDRKGELFGYIEGNTVYTLDGDVTGRIVGDLIVDTAGNSIWRIESDGVYAMDSTEAIGYFGESTPSEH